MSRKLTYIHLSDKQWITSLGFIILLLRNISAFPSLWHFKKLIWWHKCCLTRTPSYFFIYYTSTNVSINILFVAHPLRNVPQLLGRKIFRQFFHMPLTDLHWETAAFCYRFGIICSILWTLLTLISIFCFFFFVSRGDNLADFVNC